MGDIEGPSRVPLADSWAPLGFVLAMWLATHPYFGITSDARFYMLQALHSIDPGPWRDDIFFKFGTQDSYTIFTKFFRLPVAWLGPAPAHLIATIAGDALWLTALYCLCASLFEKRTERWAAFAAAVVLSGYYGGVELSYLETFVTPRLYGEALTLLALAAALRGRRLLAGCLLVGAAAIHPLMALAGVGVVFLALAWRNAWAWAIAGLFAAGVIAGSAFQLGPLGGLWRTYDPAWWAIVQSRYPFALVSEWGWLDDLRLAASLAVLAALMTVSNAREQQVITATLTLAVLALVVSLIGMEGLRNVLLSQIGLPRTLWLVTLASNMAFGILILRLSGPSRWIMAAAALLNVAGQFSAMMGLLCPWVTIVAVALAFVERRARSGGMPWRATRVALLVVVIVELAAIPKFLEHESTGQAHVLLRAVEFLVAVVAAGGLWASLKWPAARWAACAAPVMFLSSVALAQQTSPWTRYVYSGGPDDGLARFMAGSGETYWEGDDGAVVLWFRRREESFSSCLQSAEGMLFRPVAMESTRRSEVLRTLDTAEFRGAFCGPPSTPSVIGPSSARQLARVCRELPKLDTLILDHPVPGMAARSWTAPAPLEEWEHNRLVRIWTYYRYDCKMLR